MKNLKHILPDVVAVLLFAVISFAYFFPADIEGRILFQHDAAAGRNAGHEFEDYFAQTGERTRWSNNMFGGMPTYQTAPSYASTDGLNEVMKAYHLWLPENVWYVFAFLLGFYILLRAFDFRRSMAALGAIIWAFSSYFFIIIAAGHIWKVYALAYLPPMIAGVVVAYRGKYLWGFVLTALFTAFEVKANHVQMTYYYLFLIFFMVLAFLADAVRKKQLQQFFKATAVCLAAALVGILVNISNLYHTWEYSKESLRGKSELVKNNDAAQQTSSGLDRDYITQWSYGIDETWTLLVPNTKGGASMPMGQNEQAMKHASPEVLDSFQQMYGIDNIYNNVIQYWGTQPMTSGPVYVGAFVLMLFILGLFIVRGPMKWALLAATVLSVLLSWGKNFMPLTDFFIDYMPMYAKFRTPSSILVVAEFAIPLLAMMALKRIVDEPEEMLTRKMKYVYVSFGLTAGIALLFAVMPSVFFSDFILPDEVKQYSQIPQIPQDLLNSFISSIENMRRSIFTADCWRSFFIIAAGMALILLFKYRKIKAEWMIGAMIVLCIGDMWTINKRYLNDSMFVEKSVRDLPHEKSQADEMILQDESPDYRVFNVASNAFNESETSFYHKSIGGYHAAKLRRYQELIDAYIAPNGEHASQKEMQKLMGAVAENAGDMSKINGDSLFPVINMLNTKYFIFPLQDGRSVALQNIYTYGNAWFVDKVEYADNANKELEALGRLKLRHEAVADKRFEDILGTSNEQAETSLVEIKSYAPNELHYTADSKNGGVIVFSEIYYPGWTATVDGKDTPVGRVNYVLRAIKVDAGKHDIVLSFRPKSVAMTETVAYVAIAILILSILVVAGITIRKSMGKNKKQDSSEA